ncbi:hypothetical protein [Hyphobacterium marinum]|uniref:Uncharacterized protein n=1 Tax=Hyphobacterium marinum TaxID=3116574 RepID=A0ABU7LXM2_9PROT|nr:hypothetical protein [Hyphobacterium sp. Y6023]MEE2566302.1 hypothetical protein [Hyphobacterium sp. Y6023]
MFRLYVFLAAIGVLAIFGGFWLDQRVQLAATVGYGVMTAAALAMIFAPVRHSLASYILAIPLAVITWSMLTSLAAQLNGLFGLDLHPMLVAVLDFNTAAQSWLMGLIFGESEPVAKMAAESVGESMGAPEAVGGFGGRIAIDVAVAVLATLVTGVVKKLFNIGDGDRAAA